MGKKNRDEAQVADDGEVKKKRSRSESSDADKSKRKRGSSTPADNTVAFQIGAPAIPADMQDADNGKKAAASSSSKEDRKAEKKAAKKAAKKAEKKAAKKAAKKAEKKAAKKADKQSKESGPTKISNGSSSSSSSASKSASSSTSTAASSSSSDGIQFDFGTLLKSARRRETLEGCTVEESDGQKVEAFEVVEQFSQVAFSADVMKCFAGFERPTSIQSTCWAPLLRGRDVIGIAATGSGKTLAFGIPGLIHVLNNERLSNGSGRGRDRDRVVGPRMLVLAPTRELASQIAEVCETIGGHSGVKSVCVYGGVPKRDQVLAIRDGAEIVIGTPGRMLDLVAEGSLSLGRVTYVVLDEADRMLDLGFSEEIKKIMAAVTSSRRQTVMFSATWPPEIQAFGKSFMQRPMKVTIGSESLAAAHSVKQIVEVVEGHEKDRRLLALLRDYHSSRSNRCIIFVLYKKEAVRVESFLQQKGWKCIGIHGDKQQSDRTSALGQFKDGSVPLLVATDVAARGLDIPRVEYVINYSFPLTVEDYVHRIGRTGRAGQTGIAHTLFTSFDKNNAGALCNVLREAGQDCPPELAKFGPTIRKARKPQEDVLVDTSTKTHLKFDDD